MNVKFLNGIGNKIIGGGTETLSTGLFDLSDIQLTECYYGTYSPITGSTFNNMFINNCNIGACLYKCTNVTLRNVKAHNCVSYDIQNRSVSDNSIENTLIDCEYGTYDNRNNKSDSETKDSYCILNICNSFNLKVIDKDGNNIENASVKLYDKNNDLVFEELTDENGLIPEQIVKIIRDEIWKLASNNYDPVRTIYTYNPFRLVIEKTGKQIYESIFTIDQKQNLIISLSAPTVPQFVLENLDADVSNIEIAGEVKTIELEAEIKT